jgi:hypothetical protein
MKKTRIIYWVVTGLFGLFMISTAIPNIMVDKGSVDLISTMLGFPKYFIPFIGVAKLLGAIAILVPGFPRVKEWAYAGIFFDLAGATYGSIAVMGFNAGTPIMFLFIAFELLSYYYYHRLQNEKASQPTSVAATASTVNA